jgi:hypothetical protein
MLSNDLVFEQIVTGSLLVLSMLVFAVGGILYTGRAIWKWPAGSRSTFLIWERSFVMAAVLIATLGFMLLDRLLEAAGDQILAPAGVVIFLVGAVLVMVAETFFLSRQEWVYAPIVVYIFLSFLAQAIFGFAILRTNLLPGWVGWTAILWCLGWMIALPIARPKDMYYPWLYYVVPLLIGITLLLKG